MKNQTNYKTIADSKLKKKILLSALLDSVVLKYSVREHTNNNGTFYEISNNDDIDNTICPPDFDYVLSMKDVV